MKPSPWTLIGAIVLMINAGLLMHDSSTVGGIMLAAGILLILVWHSKLIDHLNERTK